MNVAVIGAGWAGMAAAVGLAQAGIAPTVFETARATGGRARAFSGHGPTATVSRAARLSPSSR